jgi:iron-sulfur cluster repair protein YtfE (RIC family)
MLEEIFLLRPIDVVRFFHNAFRRDMSQIDNSVLKVAREGGDMAPYFDRLQLIGEILDYHARGEEAGVFPAVDNIAPFVAKAYIMDHRELDNMVNGLEAIRKAPDPLTAARATAVLNSHLRIHLDKEDAHLYPILRERTTDDEQAAIGKILASKTPPERFPIQVQWLFPLLDTEEQVAVTRVWMSLMPPPVFTMLKPLIKKSVSANWVMLTQQIPELSDK